MGKPSQTELAVLAALSVEPMTGYALREAIVSELGMFWSESFGQIYPALARLREAGLVEVVESSRSRSPVHRLTPAGREHLVALLREPVVAAPPRNGLLLRLFFGGVLGPAACTDLVLDARRRAEETLVRLAEARRSAEVDAGHPQQPYWLMTVSAGEHAARATLAWAEETLDVLTRLADPGV
ncbi:PadR family transcriptional regulator [Actinotalea sp. Marseille-Q4924]|uniref:PadR family transcriptional regulator n=1 Tax=Actinotalea sp. Marseille-Q4924 TaxID=2866571 RepID=UPI001CE3DC65|nr:PadR family transcriptional regulator [Actinotalea sp. Marseille-Q4924]